MEQKMKGALDKITSKLPGGVGHGSSDHQKENNPIDTATKGFEYVHPRQTNEPLLGRAAGIKPTSHPGETVKLYVTEGLWSCQLFAKLPIIDDNLPHTAVSSFSIRVPQHQEGDKSSSSEEEEEKEKKKASRRRSSKKDTQQQQQQQPKDLHIAGKSISTREKVVFVSNTTLPSSQSKTGLMETQNTILAFGIKHATSFKRTYTIYGTQPYVHNQKPSHNGKLEEDHNDLDREYGAHNSNDYKDARPKRQFYTWMKVDENLLENKISIDLYVGLGVKGANKKGFKTNAFVSQRIKTGFLSANTVLWSMDGHPAMLMRQGKFPEGVKGPAWELTVAPGVDPMLMVCLVSILDETDAGAF